MPEMTDLESPVVGFRKGRSLSRSDLALAAGVGVDEIGTCERLERRMSVRLTAFLASLVGEAEAGRMADEQAYLLLARREVALNKVLGGTP